MPLPKQIKIGGKCYKVLHQDEIIGDRNQKLLGQIKYDNSLIRISKEFSGHEANTLLHECIHGILDDRSQQHKEILVEQLTNGLIALLRDNPSLKKYLLTSLH